MNVLDAQRTLDTITATAAHEPDEAAEMERWFHRQVLEEVRDGHPDAAVLARIACRTIDLFET